MGIKSMTGYGRGEVQAGDIAVTVEIASVNRKQFDARISLPRNWVMLEPRVRKLLKDHIVRGSLSVNVRVDVSDSAVARTLTVNEAVIRAYMAQLRQSAQQLKLADDLKASHLIGLPGVFREKETATDDEHTWRVMKRALTEAVAALTGMREAEGAALERDIGRRLQRLRRLAGNIRDRAPRVTEQYRRNLCRRLADAGVTPGAIEEPMAREVALMADKADISEELVRLDSHFDQVARHLTASKPAGRTLDFVCQELFREINTIGSKANDVQISRKVIQFKAELECVREQVQNVE